MTAVILTAVLSACGKKNTDTLTKGEWISLINEKAGILPVSQEKPYYINISENSRWFDDVQAAVEWQVLDPAVAFNPSEYLNREWTAYTLMNLADRHSDKSDSSIRDISKTSFPNEVSAAISSGLMSVDKRGMFRPKTEISREEALDYLDQIVSYINNREIPTVTDITWNDDVVFTDPQILSLDTQNKTAVCANTDEIRAGDLFTMMDDDGLGLYRITSVADDSFTYEIPEDPLALTDDFHISSSEAVDFTRIEIYDGNGSLIYDGTQETGNAVSDHLSLMADKPYTRKFEIDGNEVEVRISSGSLICSIRRQLGDAAEINGQVSLTGMNVDYDAEGALSILKNSYFKLTYDTEEYLSVSSDYDRTFSKQFEHVRKDGFVAALNNACSRYADKIDTVISLLKLKIPVGDGFTTTLQADVNLNLKASGKAELTLSQHHELGFDIRNGERRRINETKKKNSASIKAAASLTADLTAALKFLLSPVCDLTITAGASADMDTLIHIYDDDGKLNTVSDDVPPDLADAAAQAVKDVLICTDASGFYILKFKANSSSTAAGKLGFGFEADIFNEGNSQLFKKGVQHFENWQAVDHCTRKDRDKSEEREEMDTKEKIVLDSYSITVGPGESRTVEIAGIPSGYSMNDLSVTSSDPDVVLVQGLTLYGNSSGSAVITIQTKDGAYSVQCSVLVPERSG